MSDRETRAHERTDPGAARLLRAMRYGWRPRQDVIHEFSAQGVALAARRLRQVRYTTTRGRTAFWVAMNGVAGSAGAEARFYSVNVTTT